MAGTFGGFLRTEGRLARKAQQSTMGVNGRPVQEGEGRTEMVSPALILRTLDGRRRDPRQVRSREKVEGEQLKRRVGATGLSGRQERQNSRVAQTTRALPDSSVDYLTQTWWTGDDYGGGGGFGGYWGLSRVDGAGKVVVARSRSDHGGVAVARGSC